MNFKLEINYIDITNYPYLEKHFEKMAREGWLISKLIVGGLFIYKKIEPEELEFSISPYEIETFFTRKTKADIEEFQTVCQYVGWNYASKTQDLHIYYKNKYDKAASLNTDEEETFRTLETISKKYKKTHYILAAYMVFMSWWVTGGVFNDIHDMKDGMQQILFIILPMALLMSVYHIIDLNRFLKKNRINLESGLSLEFDDSKKILVLILLNIFSLVILFFIAYLIYAGFILKNTIVLLGLFPLVMGVSIGSLYRFIIKPWRKGAGTKTIVFILGLFVTMSITATFGTYAAHALINRDKIPDTDGFKVLSIVDILDDSREESGDLYRNASFLIPNSYEYTSYGDGYIRTEYSKALNESLAKNLVKRYIKQAETALIGQISHGSEYYFENNIYNSFFELYGITEEDFYGINKDNIKKATNQAIELSKEKSIIPGDKEVWDVDEIYFLSFTRDELVLRKGREVFYLGGDDISQNGLGFLDDELIDIVKDKLDL